MCRAQSSYTTQKGANFFVVVAGKFHHVMQKRCFTMSCHLYKMRLHNGAVVLPIKQLEKLLWTLKLVTLKIVCVLPFTFTVWFYYCALLLTLLLWGLCFESPCVFGVTKMRLQYHSPCMRAQHRTCITQVYCLIHVSISLHLWCFATRSFSDMQLFQSCLDGTCRVAM